MSDTHKTVIEDALTCDPSLFISCIPTPPFDRQRIRENWTALVNEVKRLQPIEHELADLKAQHAWRPIETAPKDGTSVLILCEKDRVCSAQWQVVPFVGTGWFCCVPCCYGWAFGSDTFIHGKEDQPTHWQPLPEPPKEGQK